MPILPVDKDYIINVGPGGTFRQSGSYQTVPAEIDNMFNRFERDGVKRISIYFHGGLVSESGGIETAHKVYPFLANAGTTPICFVWETGLKETVANNLSKLSQTNLFNKILKAILKKVTERVAFETSSARGVAGNALSDLEIAEELSKPDPFYDFSRSAGSDARRAVNLNSLKGKEAIIEVELKREFEVMISRDEEFKSAVTQTRLTVDAAGPTAGSRGIVTLAKIAFHLAKITIRVIKRFIKKRDHDLYPTIVEEILREFYVAELGAWVWKGMKDKASDMWKINSGLTGNNQHAGRYFLDKLIAYKSSHPDTTVDLVGHSAGSIAICNLLATTASLPGSFVFNHILFLAPACRIDLFKQEISDHSERFGSLRIFTMSDQYECKDMLVPYVYTHSLLYLISGILEEEGVAFDAYILGLERHVKFAPPYNIVELQDIHRYIYTNGSNRICFSVTTESIDEGLRTHSLSHGGFDDDSFTMESVQYILTNK